MDNETDKRRNPRHEVPLEATLHSGGQAIPCQVRNISAGGALVEVQTTLRPGQAIDVEIPELGKMAGRVVRVFWKLAGISLDQDEGKIDSFIVEWLERGPKEIESP